MRRRPPTDWTLYDTHYTERYLGLDPDVYYRNGIVQDAPKLERPLMLIHVSPTTTSPSPTACASRKP